MLRKFVCAAVIVVIGLSAAMAEDIQAIISKVDGNKVTFKKAGKKGAADGDDMTLTVKADAKITKGVYNADTKKLDAGDAIADGLKSDTFTKIGEKGLRATITTDADNKNIVAITVGGKGKKKAN
ncbi:MAG TPA: hypothetical protein VNX28_08885 [Gemmataceae bacterium]|jgi:hypothetical protein|nr:hypothetical protein [Gemmataceae bacterium]